MTVAEIEYIDKKVLIKETGSGFHDKVFLVKGIPKDLLFTENGNLQAGISKSATGDGAFVFDITRESRERLELVDRYIASVYPRHLPAPKRVYNAQQPGDSRSAPLTVELLESNFKEQFRVDFVDLPIPEDGMILSKSKTSSEMAIGSFSTDDIFPSTAIPEQKKDVPASNLMCAQCDYTAKNKHGLVIHIGREHKKDKGGSTDNPS